MSNKPRDHGVSAKRSQANYAILVLDYRNEDNEILSFSRKSFVESDIYTHLKNSLRIGRKGIRSKLWATLDKSKVRTGSLVVFLFYTPTI